MIILKTGAADRYEKSRRRRAYLENPAYVRRCEMCGAKFLFRASEIIRLNSVATHDEVNCPYCGQSNRQRPSQGRIPYWHWRLFYEKKYAE